MLELIDGQMGDHHSGEMKRESAQAKAERIIAEELKRLEWTQADLHLRLKTDPCKIAIATRLRKETILPIKWIAAPPALGHLEKRQDPIASGQDPTHSKQ